MTTPLTIYLIMVGSDTFGAGFLAFFALYMYIGGTCAEPFDASFGNKAEGTLIVFLVQS